MSTRTSGPQRALERARLEDDLIVTGEAVALEARPASPMLRVLSGAIDLVTIAAAAILLFVAASPLIIQYLNPAQEAALTITYLVFATVGVPVLVETLSRGRSLGKLATGVRVVRDDGGPVRLRHALVRALVGFFELWMMLGSIAFITAVLNRRGKRLGDLLAGTYAARVRGYEHRPPPLVMPPELAEWAAAADIRALPDGLGMTARHFLQRTGSMDAAARETMGRELAAQAERLVSPPPPWGTHPERFLAAVLVARRDREYEVGLRTKERQDREAAQTARLPHHVGER